MTTSEIAAVKVDLALVWFLRAATFFTVAAGVALFVNALRGVC